MTLFELLAVLTLDKSQFDKGIDGAGQKAKSFGGALKGGVAKAGKIAVGAVAAVGGATAAAGVALTKATGSVASYGDNIDKMSQKMGISATAYQEWDAIMQHSGASIESLKPSMKTLAVQAQKGSDAFQKLGISQEEVASLSQEELFSKVISGLQDMESGTERTALASQLLGRGATELGALLNTSSEDTQKMRDRVHELNGVMSDEAVKASAKYQDTLQDMSTAFEGVKRNAISEFLPGVTMIMEGITNIFAGEDGGVQKITDGVSTIIEKIGEVAPKFVGIVTSVAGSVGQAIMDNLPQITQFLVDGVIGLASTLIENAPVFLDAVMSIMTTVGNSVMEFVPTLLEKLPDLINMLMEGMMEYVPQMLERVPEIFQMLMEGMAEFVPQIMEIGGKLVAWIGEGLVTAVPVMVEMLMQLIEQITTFLAENAGSIIEAGMNLLNNLLQGIMDAIPKLLEYLPTIIENLVTALAQGAPKFLEGGMKLLLTLQEGILKALPKLIESVPKIFKGLIDAVMSIDWLGLGKSIIEFIGKGIINLATHLPQILLSIGKAAIDLVTSINWLDLGKNIIIFIGKGIIALVTNIPKALVSIAKNAGKAFTDVDWLGVGKDLILGIGKGIVKFAKNLVTAAVDAAKSAIDAVKGWLGISSPSKRAEKEIGKWMALGVGVGWEKNMPVDEMQDSMQEAFDSIQPVLNNSFIPDETEYVVSTSEDGNSKQRATFAPVFNIYGSDGQSVEELAQIVMDRLAFEYERQGSVFA